jgi:hypothetical protein
VMGTWDRTHPRGSDVDDAAIKGIGNQSEQDDGQDDTAGVDLSGRGTCARGRSVPREAVRSLRKR